MPDFQHKPRVGSLWPSDRKMEDWHYDLSGKILFVCESCGKETLHYLGGYTNEHQGRRWIKVVQGKAVTEHESRPAATTPAPSTTNENIDPDDDIPF